MVGTSNKQYMITGQAASLASIVSGGDASVSAWLGEGTSQLVQALRVLLPLFCLRISAGEQMSIVYYLWWSSILTEFPAEVRTREHNNRPALSTLHVPSTGYSTLARNLTSPGQL